MPLSLQRDLCYASLYPVIVFRSCFSPAPIVFYTWSARDWRVARVLVESQQAAAAVFEEWVLGERQYLRGRAVDALHRLAAAYTRQGNYAEAIDALRGLLALEPWREEAHRQLIQLLALSGQRSAALNARLSEAQRTALKALGAVER